MLNKDGKRELCYTVKIDNIEPIVGSDNCEAAVVGGWKIMVRKNTFKPGDIAVYFEIDSKVPETKEFEFLACWCCTLVVGLLRYCRNSCPSYV